MRTARNPLRIGCVLARVTDTVTTQSGTAAAVSRTALTGLFRSAGAVTTVGRADAAVYLTRDARLCSRAEPVAAALAYTAVDLALSTILCGVAHRVATDGFERGITKTIAIEVITVEGRIELTARAVVAQVAVCVAALSGVRGSVIAAIENAIVVVIGITGVAQPVAVCI